MGPALMARPRGKRAEGGPPEKSDPSPSFSMKGDPEWVEWVVGLAEHCRMTKAGLVDAALVEYARLRGYTKAAPPRFKSK